MGPEDWPHLGERERDHRHEIYGKIDEWRQRSLMDDFSYALFDGLTLTLSRAAKNVLVLVAIGVS